MTIHVWASPNLPVWYVIDTFDSWATKALGSGWALKQIFVDTLKFVDETGKTYPMSKRVSMERMQGGTLYHLLRDARNEGAYGVAMSVDVHVMDAAKQVNTTVVGEA